MLTLRWREHAMVRHHGECRTSQRRCKRGRARASSLLAAVSASSFSSCCFARSSIQTSASAHPCREGRPSTALGRCGDNLPNTPRRAVAHRPTRISAAHCRVVVGLFRRSPPPQPTVSGDARVQSAPRATSRASQWRRRSSLDARITAAERRTRRSLAARRPATRAAHESRARPRAGVHPDARGSAVLQVRSLPGGPCTRALRTVESEGVRAQQHTAPAGTREGQPAGRSSVRCRSCLIAAPLRAPSHAIASYGVPHHKAPQGCQSCSSGSRVPSHHWG